MPGRFNAVKPGWRSPRRGPSLDHAGTAFSRNTRMKIRIHIHRQVNRSRKVLQAYRKAYAWRWINCWVIYTGERVARTIGTGQRTQRLAWRSAKAAVGQEASLSAGLSSTPR
jgi:hypothetical protein